MKQLIKHIYSICIGIFLLISASSFIPAEKTTGFSLTVEVDKLRNSTGTVLFALYNREDAFPDEHYTKYLKKLTGKIVNGSASFAKASFYLSKDTKINVKIIYM